jgi:hypothetical protein
LLSLANPENEPPDKVAEFIPLAVSTDKAEELADIVVQRYGGNKIIYRVVAVDDGGLLNRDPTDVDIIRYSGETISSGYLEVFEVIAA